MVAPGTNPFSVLACSMFAPPKPISSLNWCAQCLPFQNKLFSLVWYSQRLSLRLQPNNSIGMFNGCPTGMNSSIIMLNTYPSASNSFSLLACSMVTPPA